MDLKKLAVLEGVKRKTVGQQVREWHTELREAGFIKEDAIAVLPYVVMGQMLSEALAQLAPAYVFHAADPEEVPAEEDRPQDHAENCECFACATSRC